MKNGGNIPAVPKQWEKINGEWKEVVDGRVLWIAYGCGRCMECMKQKAREWQIRLAEDIKENKNGKMITLTFSNESIRKLKEESDGRTGYELDNWIATIAVRRFTEKWRKEYGKTIIVSIFVIF